MKENSTIKLYNTRTFTNKFMPSDELRNLLKGDYNKFLLVPVEQMYRHVAQAVPPSRAVNHTFIYLTEGEAYMKIGSEKYKIYKDEMLIVPAGQIFSFEEYNSSKFNKGFLCNFNEEFLLGKFGKSDLLKDLEFLKVWGNPRIDLGKETSGFVLQLLKRILIEYAKNGLDHLDIIQSYFIALLCEINQVYKPLFNTKQNAAVSLTNNFKELLSRHIKTKHRVTDYASMLNISPNHLNKIVKSVTSKSPTKWIDEAIVLEAKVLLYQTDFSIGEVAAAIGIYDQSYFSRLFKKYAFVTPLQFSKMIEMSW